ncbi:MAG: hypothetical protein HDR09_12755 [Lachnospiraceae bacterium]|nr:hypothetical protein [Lachnospiraceae bacterium]
MDYDCNYCTHINMTEDEQIDKRSPHICLWYGKCVRHRVVTKKHSAFLFPCDECVNDGYSGFERKGGIYDSD